MIDKWICMECHFVGLRDDFDHVKDPHGEDTWVVCPECRTPEHAVYACDEPGCDKESSCGFPTAEGYRRTCFEHSIWKFELHIA